MTTNKQRETDKQTKTYKQSEKIISLLNFIGEGNCSTQEQCQTSQHPPQLHAQL